MSPTRSLPLSLPLLLLLALAAVKTAVIVWVVEPAQAGGFAPTGTSTRDLYIDIARQVVAGHGYRVTADTAETMVRNPGYIALLSGLIEVFGDSLTPVRVANVLLALGTVWLTGLLARRCTDSGPAILGAMLIAGLYPPGLLLESRAGVESLFTFLLVLSVWLTVRAAESQRLGGALLAGAGVGVLCLVRSSPVFVLPLLAVWLFFRLRTAGARSVAVLAPVGMVVMAALVLAPWAIRNYQLAGTLTVSESHVGIGAWQGWYATATMDQPAGYQARVEAGRDEQPRIAGAAGVRFERVKWPSDTRWDIYPTIQDELRYSRALLDYTLVQMRADPAMAVRHVALNVLRFWFQGADSRLTVFLVVLQLPLLALAAAGAWLMRARPPLAVLLLLPIAVIWAIHVPLIAHARYAVPLAPLLAVLAAPALAVIADRALTRFRTPAAAAHPRR